MDPKLAEQFSLEELEAMGEIEPEPTPDPGNPEPKAEPTSEPEPKPEPTPEPKEPEKKDGEPEPEPEPEEGKPVPYDRFAKVYGRAKQTEREKAELAEKLDLFKRNQEEYFEKYPDEKPADYKPSAAAKAEPPIPEKVHTFKEMLGARVNDPQNPAFHGKSLGELLQGTPEEIAAAHDYYAEYVNDVRGKVDQAKQAEQTRIATMQQEDAAFQDARATELFGKPMSGLDAEQKGKIEKVVKDTLAWMKANGRLAYKLEDAFKVMTYDDAIRTAGEKGAKALVDRAQKGQVRSVAAGPSGEKSTDPYAAYLNLTEDALVEKINGMTETDYVKFLTNATPAFRQKFPSLPYTM
jgi:hypothetical protein